jgi:hypothetical protein
MEDEALQRNDRVDASGSEARRCQEQPDEGNVVVSTSEKATGLYNMR